MNFSWVDELVAGSARPLSKEEVDWLREVQKVDAILSLTETPLDPEWIGGMKYKHIPIPDHTAPTLEQIYEGLEFVDTQVASKNKVLVHCLAGKGRTGTMLAAYLCQKGGSSPEDAIAKLRVERPGSVERNQRSILEAFFDSLGKKKKSRPDDST